MRSLLFGCGRTVRVQNGIPLSIAAAMPVFSEVMLGLLRGEMRISSIWGKVSTMLSCLSADFLSVSLTVFHCVCLRVYLDPSVFLSFSIGCQSPYKAEFMVKSLATLARVSKAKITKVERRIRYFITNLSISRQTDAVKH